MKEPRFNPRLYHLLVLVFGIFSLGQFLSGGLLYLYKAGGDYSSTLVYYKGTEQAEVILQKKLADSYVQPRSFYGLIEIACAHAAAYALLCFILAHFLRSLSANSLWSNCFSLVLFGLGLLEILSTFGARYGPPWFSLIRFLILWAFVLCGTLASLALLWLCLRNDRRA